MPTYRIFKDHQFSPQSDHIPVKSKQKYKIEANVTGLKGSPYCGYLCCLMFDNDGKEINRPIRWLNNFTGKPNLYSIVFSTPVQAKTVKIGYRINSQTPATEEIEIVMPDIHSIQLQEVNSKEIDDADDLFDDRYKQPIPAMPPLTAYEEDYLESKLVWIFSPPRSGTTWLGTRLLNHPNNAIWNEPWLGSHLGHFLSGNEITKDAQATSESINVPFKRQYDIQKANDDYFFSSNYKNNWLSAIRKLILMRTFAQIGEIDKNVIIKEPNGSQGADIIMECLPNSKMIFLVRDGRDVVDSRIDMHRPGSWSSLPALTSPEARMEAIIKYSYLWSIGMLTCLRAFRRHNPDLRLLVRYEDLRTNTLGEAKKIYEFLNIDISNEELSKLVELNDFKNISASDKGPGKFNRAASSGGWQKNFNEQEQESMTSIMTDTLLKMGYQI